MHPHMSNWAFVIPWWNWWSCYSNLSLSEGGMMRASSWGTRPSSMVRVSWCCQYGCSGWGLPWCHLTKQWWWCWQGCASWDHSWRFVGMLPSALGTGEHGGWQCPVGCQGQDMDWNERMCWAGPFPYWASNRWYNHSPGGAVACAVAGLACVPGSSGKLIPVACGLTQW